MKIATSKLHLELLDKERHAMLLQLIPFSRDFVLGGGTALALQLNHRKSFDFDFFSPRPIPKQLLEHLSRTIPPATVSIDTADELTFFDQHGIKITFLTYPFTPRLALIETDLDLKLYSISDIAIQKAYTIGRRGEYRDYFDLFSILSHNHTTLKVIIDGAASVYGDLFNPKIFLEQLVYFDDLQNMEITPAIETEAMPSPDQVKLFLEQAVHHYLQ